EIRRHIDSHEMSRNHGMSVEKWRQAEALLWGAESTAQLTTIGHLCREAIQEFALELAHKSGVGVDQKAKTVANIRAVLDARRQFISKSHSAFLDALLAYWGTVSDLIQRQEHGSDNKESPINWEDARRVVFQTLVLMYELSR